MSGYRATQTAIFSSGRGNLNEWEAHPTLLGGQQREQRAAVQLSHQQLRHTEDKEKHLHVHDELFLRFYLQWIVVRRGWGSEAHQSDLNCLCDPTSSSGWKKPARLQTNM